MTNKKIQDADLSNAGDDFHVLWTMHKSYQLLNFDSAGLKAIVIEDVERIFSRKFDPTGEKLLGIDLSEYYGGKDFESANRIVISQLKYSTRKANDPYNFSALYHSNKGKMSHDGSIIHRLAGIFKTFLKARDRNEVLRKIRIKLVSNRNMNSSQLAVLQEIKDFLLASKRRITFPLLIQQPFIKYKKSLTTLFKASSLNDQEFLDFLKILDFEDCGANSRNGLKLALINAISETSVTYQTHFNALYLMIWNKCMPESDSNRMITDIDLISSLGFDGGLAENIFPVTQSFIHPNDSVIREQLKDILFLLNNKKHRIICLHGGAGIGKSTIVHQIQEHLPDYSESIIYDCYGKGAYQYDSDKRHLPKYALVQLANELAKKVGTNFLINREASDEVYIKEFEKRLEKAVEILKKRDHRASLNVIIDAADNTVVAAHLHNESHFISQLTNFRIPEDCNIIFTTRTYRKDSLQLPENTKEFALQPFSLLETTLFLRQRFPDVTNEHIQEFHKYTGGIPRSQFYALDLKLKGIDDLINYLKPNGKTVEDFILDKIWEAEERLGKTEKHLIRNFLTLLIMLPRPVPLRYLAQIMKVSDDFLLDLKSELWTGLICENNQFEFRDEDFENFIREKYQLEGPGLFAIAEVFLQKSTSEFYAAKSLGYILYNSNRYNDLKKIVLKRQYLDAIIDPIRKKEIYIQRVQQAIKLSKSERDYLTLSKLILIAAEEAKTDKALSNLLISHPDLILQYGDEYSLQKFKLSSEKTTWGGSFHLKLAGTYSRQNKDVALRHLNIANDWLIWEKANREELKKNSQNNYNIYASDLTGEFEAILRIFGLSKAIKSLFRWKPVSTRLEVGNMFIDRLLQYPSQKDYSAWIKEAQNERLDVIIFLVTKLFQFHHDIPYNVIDLAKKLTRYRNVKFEQNFSLVLLDFCEILLYKGCKNELVLEILDLIRLSSLDRIPYFGNSFNDGNDENNMDLVLRSYILRCIISKKTLDIEELYPNQLQESIGIKNKRRNAERDKKEFDNFYSVALQIYELRIRFFENKVPKKELINLFKDICEQMNSNFDYDYRAGYRAQDQKLFFVTKLSEILCLLRTESLAMDLLESFYKVSYKRVRFAILDQTKFFSIFDNLNLQLLNEIDLKCEEITTTSQDLVDDYIRCSIISANIDLEIGKHFFEKAITSVQEIEFYEAYAKIRCVYHLTTIGIKQPDPILAYTLARFVEYCNLSLQGYDNKHFPFEIALIGVGNLDVHSIFTTLGRWHHRDVVNICSYALIMLEQAMKKSFFDHKETAALLPIYQHNFYNKDLINFIKKILNGYDEGKDTEGKTAFVEQLFNRYRLAQDRNFLRDLYREIQSGAFVKRETLEKIRKYLSFLEEVDEKDTTDIPFREQEVKYDYDVVGINVISVKELEAAIAEIIKDEEYYGRAKVDKFLKDIQLQVIPSKFVQHLDTLIAIDSNLLDYYSLEKALESRLKAWSKHPAVLKWKEKNFKPILYSWFHHFNENGILDFYSINQLTKKFDVAEEMLADALLELVSEKIETLSDESIYDLFEFLKCKLNQENNERLLRWALERWSTSIKADVADGPWHEKLMPPQNKDEVVAEFLRFLLGHPIKSTRWRAIHSIVNLVSQNKIQVLEYLLANQNVPQCPSFQDETYLFYWISAKLYLWIAIDRISIKYPETLLEFKTYFIHEIEDKKLPHILIKYLVRKSALQILKVNPNFLDVEEISNFEQCLISPFDKVQEERLTRRQRKYKNGDNNWSFPFDRLDTLPYGYNSLGGVFNLSELDVADIAERYIVESWGYTGNPDKDDYIMDQLHQKDYELTRDRYAKPSIENIQTYFEYHGMLCAAHDLLKNEPQIQDHHRSWDEWLRSQGMTWDNYWISDLVDPIPLQKKFWEIEYNLFDLQWRDTIENEKFDKEVGFSQLYDGGLILPHAHYTRILGENTESVYIRSALVSPDTAPALLRALYSVEDPHSYAFPLENEDGSSNEIANGKFQLLSWIKYKESQAKGEGLDQHDYQYQAIGYSLPILGDSILKLFPIKITENFKRGYYNHQLVMQSRNWNEVSDDKYRSENTIESEGEMLFIGFDFILSILKKTGNFMIVKCQIEKQLKDRQYYSDDNGRPWEHTKLYLIKDDGTIKTIGEPEPNNGLGQNLS